MNFAAFNFLAMPIFFGGRPEALGLVSSLAGGAGLTQGAVFPGNTGFGVTSARRLGVGGARDLFRQISLSVGVCVTRAGATLPRGVPFNQERIRA